ncbi:MAG: gliding motility-associated C-terminal domain-containing protein [Flavobacteriales bacterium]|nr:gliding motility-associated C-terminal domain-containing protein [Flavobacteriales bacterium]
MQNATTAQITDDLNATVQGCGWLVEPPGGIIPPGSAVLMVTSTQMCTAANSFTNLSDTLFIVFQAPGNSSGHFANHNNGATISATPSGASSTRTLILTYLPTSCSDTATYDRALLTNVYGTYGGTSAENDGATAEFTWPGPAQVSYVNYGCQAPFVPLLVEVVYAEGSICNGTGSVLLTGSASGDFISLQWQGGTGTFSDPNNLTTAYLAGPGDVGAVVIQFCAIGTCGATICVDYTLPSGSAPLVTITPDGPTTLCPGESVTLTASGADTYEWSGQETTASITVSTPGTYSVTGTNACGSGSAQIDITLANGPAVAITPDGPTALCPGESVTLTASGADSYLWSTQETSTSITVSQPGTITVTGTNACGTGSAQIDITLGTDPQVSIAASGPTALCPGQNVTLTASGADSYVWSTQETSASITVSQAGTYSVTGTNACGTGNASTDVTVVSVAASFTTDVSVGDAPLEVVFTNTSSPANASMSWQFGDGGSSTAFSPTHTYLSPGTFTVVLTVTEQGCTATASGQIQVLGSEVPPSSVFVPNVFTPNGDGSNDQLRLQAIGMRQVDLSIYNRYGQLVARLERGQQSWDGRTFAGEMASSGTYFYVLEAEGLDGKAHELQGSITLLR